MPVQRWPLIRFVATLSIVATEVAYISNFTDVDDKIINRAKGRGHHASGGGDKYIAAFREDVTASGVKPATRHPRVVGVYG